MIFQAQKIQELHSKYERYVSPIALLTGFIADNLTLRRVDLLAENIAILSYLFIVGASILVLNAHDAGRLKSRIIAKLSGLLTFFMQFAFGGLFSAFFVFYFRSASVTASWPFLFVLAFLLIGNEVFRKRYSRLIFQLSIYFIAVFSYSVFVMPIILRKINDSVFLISGIVSVGLIFLFTLAVYFILPERFKQSRTMLFKSIGGIYLLFNIFYFTNIIPPIPLSMKEGGIYYYVERQNGDYILQSEPAPIAGQPVYCFTAVFAPAKINTEILHVWYFFDEVKGEWVEKSRLGFPITGGRDGGYRGYSVKNNVEPGKWRVDVITSQGKILGRIKFEVAKQ